MLMFDSSQPKVTVLYESYIVRLGSSFYNLSTCWYLGIILLLPIKSTETFRDACI